MCYQFIKILGKVELMASETCNIHWFHRLITVLLFPPGDVVGQVTVAPPSCPGDFFTFRCRVTGDRNGITIWRLNRDSECTLAHSSTSTSNCGPGNIFTATAGTGFGTSGPSFTSTLTGTATPTLNGTLVECFGPGLVRDAENMVGDGILQILGQYLYPSHVSRLVFSSFC